MGRWLHGRLVYPAIVVGRGEGAVFQRLRELERIQFLSSDELAERQNGFLAGILTYAAERCPLYRGSGGSGGPIAPREARAVLAEYPFLQKRDLQENLAALLARPGPRRVTRKTTGGSTGQPVTVFKDRSATACEMAASWLGYGWFGVRVGDRAARFWGSPHGLRRRLRFVAADFAMHRIRFSAFAFDEDDLERYWRRCVNYRPDYFYGYVSMLEAFAQFVRARRYDGTQLRLRSVVTTSEVLSPPQRDLIHSVFGAPVQDEYGCGEVGPIAYECEHGRFHVMSENLLVEVVAEDGKAAEPGRTGEIVVTDLNNRAMPLIRYRLGDFAVAGDTCPCGRGFPVLDRIWGRAYDFVEGADGRRYHGEFFMYLFEDLRSEGLPIGQFQITQLAPRSLEVLVVTPESASGVESVIRLRLMGRLAGVEVSVRRVPSIPREASGKMRVIRSGMNQGRAR